MLVDGATHHSFPNPNVGEVYYPGGEVYNNLVTMSLIYIYLKSSSIAWFICVISIINETNTKLEENSWGMLLIFGIWRLTVFTLQISYVFRCSFCITPFGIALTRLPQSGTYIRCRDDDLFATQVRRWVVTQMSSSQASPEKSMPAALLAEVLCGVLLIRARLRGGLLQRNDCGVALLLNCIYKRINIRDEYYIFASRNFMRP